jgi:hypothetical protein
MAGHAQTQLLIQIQHALLSEETTIEFQQKIAMMEIIQIVKGVLLTAQEQSQGGFVQEEMPLKLIHAV